MFVLKMKNKSIQVLEKIEVIAHFITKKVKKSNKIINFFS